MAPDKNHILGMTPPVFRWSAGVVGTILVVSVSLAFKSGGAIGTLSATEKDVKDIKGIALDNQNNIARHEIMLIAVDEKMDELKEADKRHEKANDEIKRELTKEVTGLREHMEDIRDETNEAAMEAREAAEESFERVLEGIQSIKDTVGAGKGG